MSNYRYRRSTGYSNQHSINRPRQNRQRKKDYIDPALFVQGAKTSSDSIYIPTHTFSDFDLHPIIQTNLSRMGLVTPTAIQDQTIPPGITGKDVVGIADTGTGKTAAFAVPLLDQLIKAQNSKALILAPTRELAQQIEEECREIAKGSGIRGAVLIGGISMGPQLHDLRNRPSIVIGTPGRIKDHLDRGSLNLSSFNLIVLDEVDRMLDMGFVNPIRHILSLTNFQKQSFYFSATLDEKVKVIIESFSRDPVYITVKSGSTSENIEQNIVTYNSPSEKMDKLHDLLSQEKVIKTLVFDDTHRSVEKLSKELEARGFVVDSIHGGKSQSQRQRVLKKFKESQINILVATDVAARGLDVSDITHVVNYSTPQTYDDYVHRIGRTGRAGRTGQALTFIER